MSLGWVWDEKVIECFVVLRIIGDEVEWFFFYSKIVEFIKNFYGDVVMLKYLIFVLIYLVLIF